MSAFTPMDLRGWPAIAAFVEMNEAEARDLATREVDPLPVFRLGDIVFSRESILRTWKRRNVLVVATLLAGIADNRSRRELRTLTRRGVYAVTFETCDRIKIGFATSLLERMDSLQTAMPYPAQVIAFIPGPKSLEAAIHRQLDQHRRCGEWFENNESVRDYLVVECAERGGLTSLTIGPVAAPTPEEKQLATDRRSKRKIVGANR